jgi:Flp pilus assembly protein TadG
MWRTLTRRRRRNDRGAISPMVAVLGPAFILLVGLVYDGGSTLEARERAFDLAQQAARAGASHGIDQNALRQGTLAINEQQAQAAAMDFLTTVSRNENFDLEYSADGSGNKTGATVSADQKTIQVTVVIKHHTSFLSAFGFNDVDVHATARATVLRGVNQEEAP